MSGLTRARRWTEAVDDLVVAWRVLALKEAMDTMDVGRDSVLYPRALADLLDATLGLGGSPVSSGLLTRRRPDEASWVALGQSVGAPAPTTWEGVREALGGLLRGLCDEMPASAPDDWRDPVERIGRRAVR